MKNKNDERESDRRQFLKCMAWVGTGAVWTMTSGISKACRSSNGTRWDWGRRVAVRSDQ